MWVHTYVSIYQLSACRGKFSSINKSERKLDSDSANIEGCILVQAIRAKLVSNWEQNIKYTKNQQILCRNRLSALTGLKVSTLVCECIFFRPGHNTQ